MNSIDIAKIAGVSRSTVSRVINNYTNVPEETRQKVLEVIKQYNYVPHASARMLAGVKNRFIGLYMIDMREDLNGRKVSTSTFFSPFISAIVDYANKVGYYVLVSVVGNPKDFEKVKETFYNKTISGGIFIGVKDNEPEIKELIAEGYKVVLVDQALKSDEEIYSKCIIVNADNFNGAYKATQHLIQLGHREIAHVTGEDAQLSSVDRLEGYKKAMNDAGIGVKNALIMKGDFMEEGGYKAVKKLLVKNRPTAIFTSNDGMAIGALRAIKEAGLKVPKDISLIGFDDIEVAKYLRPSLTTVRMELMEMASIAMNTLTNSIENNTSFSANYTVSVELVERESCAPLEV